MLIREIMESVADKFEKEKIGNYWIISTVTPIRDPATNTSKYKACVKHKDHLDKILFATAGMTQQGAKDQAEEWVKQQSRPETDAMHSRVNINLNAAFIHNLFDDKSGAWFKLDTDQGQQSLIMASPEYVKTFPNELNQLGFIRAFPRSRARNPDGATDYSFTVNPTKVKNLELVFNGRYTLEDEHIDSDGNTIWHLHYHSRTSGPNDKVTLQYPAITVAAY